MAQKTPSAKEEVNPVVVGEVVALHLIRSGPHGPVDEWSLGYVTEEKKGAATEVRLAGYARTTKMKDMGGTAYTVGGKWNEAARMLADRLRPTTNKFTSQDSLKREISAMYGVLQSAKVPEPGSVAEIQSNPPAKP